MHVCMYVQCYSRIQLGVFGHITYGHMIFLRPPYMTMQEKYVLIDVAIVLFSGQKISYIAQIRLQIVVQCSNELCISSSN